MDRRISPVLVAAGAVVALSVFVIFSMLFYVPSDFTELADEMAADDGLRYWTASVFFGSFGVAAYVGWFVVLAWAVIVFFRETAGDLPLRAVGVAAAVVAGTALFDILGPGELGGSLGYAIGGGLRATIGSTLGFIVMLGIFGVCLAFATDFGFRTYLKEARTALAVADEEEEEEPTPAGTDLVARIDQTVQEVSAEEESAEIVDERELSAEEPRTPDNEPIVITLRPPIEEETLDEDLRTDGADGPQDRITIGPDGIPTSVGPISTFAETLPPAVTRPETQSAEAEVEGLDSHADLEAETRAEEEFGADVDTETEFEVSGIPGAVDEPEDEVETEALEARFETSAEVAPPAEAVTPAEVVPEAGAEPREGAEVEVETEEEEAEPREEITGEMLAEALAAARAEAAAAAPAEQVDLEESGELRVETETEVEAPVVEEEKAEAAPVAEEEAAPTEEEQPVVEAPVVEEERAEEEAAPTEEEPPVVEATPEPIRLPEPLDDMEVELPAEVEVPEPVDEYIVAPAAVEIVDDLIVMSAAVETPEVETPPAVPAPERPAPEPRDPARALDTVFDTLVGPAPTDEYEVPVPAPILIDDEIYVTEERYEPEEVPAPVVEAPPAAAETEAPVAEEPVAAEEPEEAPPPVVEAPPEPEPEPILEQRVILVDDEISIAPERVEDEATMLPFMQETEPVAPPEPEPAPVRSEAGPPEEEIPVLTDVSEEKPGVIRSLFGRKKDEAKPAAASDPLLGDAAMLSLERGRASVVLLQRRLDIGYTRASRLVEALEHEGLVGPLLESGSRDVLMSREDWEAR